MNTTLRLVSALVVAGATACTTPAFAVGGPTDLAPAPSSGPVTPEPAPVTPEPTLALPPLKDSGFEIKPQKHVSTKDAITIGWIAPKRHMTLQTSSVKPVRVDGSWQFPGQVVQPVAMTGTPIGGKPNTFTNGKRQYRFEVTINGLTPNTAYSSVARLPLSPAFKPVEQAFLTVTKRDLPDGLADKTTREVTVSVSKLHIQKDGDKGLRGRGEGRFYVRVVPVAQALSSQKWGGHTSILKFTDGDDLNLNAPIGDWVRTGAGKVEVQIQAIEDDADLGESCFWEGGGWAPSQGTSKCWDTAVATATIDLSAGGTQKVTAKVHGDPAIKFTSQVDVKVVRR